MIHLNIVIFHNPSESDKNCRQVLESGSSDLAGRLEPIPSTVDRCAGDSHWPSVFAVSFRVDHLER